MVSHTQFRCFQWLARFRDHCSESKGHIKENSFICPLVKVSHAMEAVCQNRTRSKRCWRSSRRHGSGWPSHRMPPHVRTWAPPRQTARWRPWRPSWGTPGASHTLTEILQSSTSNLSLGPFAMSAAYSSHFLSCVSASASERFSLNWSKSELCYLHLVTGDFPTDSVTVR